MVEIRPEEFYARRRAGTSYLASGDPLGESAVKLTIDATEAETFEGQLAILLTANLTARWCRRMVLSIPDVSVDRGLSCLGSGRLLDAVRKQIQRSDPFCELFEGDSCPTPGAQVHFGTEATPTSLALVGRGWSAMLGEEVHRLPESSKNPLGPGLAACLATAWACRKTLDWATKPVTQRISLWDGFGGSRGEVPVLQEVAMGRVLFQGAGAVGSTIAYLWPLFPFVAEIDVVDPDLIKVENMGGVPGFGFEDIGTAKSKLVEDYLRSSGTAATAFPEWFNGSVTPLKSYELVIPAADQRNVRAVTMENIPPLMIGGSIGPNWMAYGHRFIPFRDSCLVCRFPSPTTQPRMRCTEGQLQRNTDEAEKRRTGALAFLSLGAALLGLANLAKLAFPDAPSGSMSELWLYSSPYRALSRNESCGRSCDRTRTRALFEQFHGSKRFAYLSRG